MVYQVTAIFGGPGFDVILKLAPFKYSGVFGKQAEQQALQIHFKAMPAVAHDLERIVQTDALKIVSKVYIAIIMFHVKHGKQL